MLNNDESRDVIITNVRELTSKLQLADAEVVAIVSRLTGDWWHGWNGRTVAAQSGVARVQLAGTTERELVLFLNADLCRWAADITIPITCL